MSQIAITRRWVALAGLAAFAAAALSGCNTTQTGGVAGQAAAPPAVSGYRISNKLSTRRRSSPRAAIRPRNGRSRRCPALWRRPSPRTWRPAIRPARR